jgi:lantibiotic biosynthesis protein
VSRTSKRSPSIATGWCPLLEGPLADRALDTARSIGETLAGPLTDWGPLEGPAEARGGRRPASLAGGTAGLAILFAYLAEAGVDENGFEKSSVLLDESADTVASVVMDPSFYSGFSGVAWAVSYVTNPADDPDDPAAEVDEELLSVLGRSPWTDDYDLVSGLVGFGVYALERLPRPAAAESLQRIVDRLEMTAEPANGGLTWHTSPDILGASQRVECPDGYYNLGLAHGVPGVIALLGRISAAGVSAKRARGILDGAVTWLLRQERSDEGSRFSHWVVPGVEPGNCRSAWCYGDPGVAAALLLAARSVGEAKWERKAVEVALHAARRQTEAAGVLDAGLCHGAAGLGHVFNRMWQSTGNEELRRAAAFWLERALEMREPGTGLAGFSSAWRDDDGTFRKAPDPGLLSGIAGIALAFLAAATPIEPEWDRLLLLSGTGTM